MTRADRIRAELLARLEVERFTPMPPEQAPEPRGWTPEEQAEHYAWLVDLAETTYRGGDQDATVIAWREAAA